MKYVVAHLGARMHYAVPRMLHEAEMLSHFYTDMCAIKGWPRALGLIPPRWRPPALKRLLGRRPQGVPLAKITTFNLLSCQLAWQQARARNAREVFAASLWADKQFGRLILQEGLKGADGVYTFNSQGLEVLTNARQHGIQAVMEQAIAVPEMVQELLVEEHARFPDWEQPPPADALFLENCERQRAERQLANLILCGSEFVKQSIVARGGPAERCAVVPYGVDWPVSRPLDRERHEGPLRVLTVGTLGLRKGTPYVLEAARLLKGRADFRLIGSIGISAAAAQRVRQDLELVGPVARSEIRAYFDWADVFLLPSICEGSATVTYEALVCGLPVICTPNTGSIVRAGEDGFIVPIRDVQAIVACLVRFLDEPDLLPAMSACARKRMTDISLDSYRTRLISALTKATDPVTSPRPAIGTSVMECRP
jgi:hypothetical protein